LSVQLLPEVFCCVKAGVQFDGEDWDEEIPSLWRLTVRTDENKPQSSATAICRQLILKVEAKESKRAM
jgi:hypothetical protein